MTTETLLDIEGVSKDFGSLRAVDNVSLQVGSGEIFALLGPSGCGKSTLLRMIAGLDAPSAGDIKLDGESMVKTPANRRPINMVFQSYAVFPHMTVAANVAYGLKAEGLARAQINTRVSEALAQVHLEEQRDRKPHQLSGGQRQRVALARALIKQPRMLLLDEPLSALDAKLRDQMRLELVKLQKSVGVTFVIVTHDQAEAMAMADRIAVLSEGRLRQVATPEALYQQPTDTFVADFIGKVNLFDVSALTWADGAITARSAQLGDVHLHLQSLSDGALEALEKMSPDARWQLGLRPEKLRVSRLKSGDFSHTLAGRVGDVAFQGVNSEIEILLDQPGSEQRSLHAVASADNMLELHGLEQGQGVTCHFSTHDLMLLPERS
jgi:spermidine/putrescine ABC transporter ATP-binding subunit